MQNDKILESYLVYLNDNIQALKDYQLCTGNYCLDYSQLRKDLFADDPVIVLFAVLVANSIFNDKNLYH